MNRIAVVFLVSVYGLAGLAGLMLSSAEGAAFPELCTPILAVLAYFLTERSNKLHLPVLWANVLGIAAFLMAGRQMVGSTIEVRLLAGAHLLVYLSWIVLFQEKRLPQYWWMCALSVLQVAVGSILTNSSSYGGMLVAFMFASIWTLSLLSLYQAHRQYGESDGEKPDLQGDGLLRPASDRTTAMVSNAGENRARSLFARPSVGRDSIQLDPEARWLGARFALSMMAISFAALVVAAAFFLFIPRLWAGRTEWGSETKRFHSVAMTGFTNEIRLGDFVPMLENARRVLQVAFTDPAGNPLDLAQYCEQVGYSEPLFRGAALDTYEGGGWTGIGRQAPLANLPTGSRRGVRQQITMEPMGTPLLFAVHPVSAVRLPNSQDQAELHPMTMQVFRPETVPNDKALTYEVFSPQGPRARQVVGYAMNSWDLLEDDAFLQCTKIPTKRLPGLVRLARQITGYDSRPRPKTTEEKLTDERRSIDLLTRHLRDSGAYAYSLDSSLSDPQADPVEDFLLNRKSGHCEYFASALALLLRAVDVPSRVITGFKGGSVNALSGLFEVEQRHAHAWVEAYVGENGRAGHGRWITVDPTPAAREASVESFASRMRAAHELASVVNSTWSRFVVNMDINAQQTAFYIPILTAVRNWWRPSGGSRPLLTQIYDALVDFATDPTQWFTVKGLVAAVVLGAALALFVLMLRMRSRAFRFLRSLLKRRGGRREIRIPFYERFEALCAQIGLVRTPAQTQQEFAGAVGPRIERLADHSNGLAEMPARLVDLFYRVRFGEEELGPAVLNRLNEDLTQLERFARNPHPRKSENGRRVTQT